MTPLEYRLLASVSARHNVQQHQVCSKSRLPHVVRARHEWIESVYGSIGSLSETARRVGMDHTSVMHALRKRGLTGPLGVPRKVVQR